VFSCKVRLEHDGEMYELDADIVRVSPLSRQPVKWVIHGISIRVNPISGSIPKSESGTGLDK